MSVAILALELALVAAAAVLLSVVLLRRGRGVSYVALALLLIGLAAVLWYLGMRTPPKVL
ncbi:MAG TPA: hypothetical protein VM070_07335 [Candidatus Saccharimonadales bacterium]|nr:hypothetical protein [Candidatus Saccharimonadales bacterium]